MNAPLAAPARGAGMLLAAALLLPAPAPGLAGEGAAGRPVPSAAGTRVVRELGPAGARYRLVEGTVTALEAGGAAAAPAAIRAAGAPAAVLVVVGAGPAGRALGLPVPLPIRAGAGGGTATGLLVPPAIPPSPPTP